MQRSIDDWPKSLPDYVWPKSYGLPPMRAVRWTLAGVFHLAHAIGRIAGFINSRVRRPSPAPTLLIRTDGIGDALLFEPAIETLAQTASPSELHLWAPRATCELLAECPTISRRLRIPRGGKDGNLAYFKSIYFRARIGFELGFWKFEKAIYPVQSAEPLGNWLLTSARTRQRWMNSGDLDNQFDWQRDQALNHATRVLEHRPGNAHEILRNEYLSDQWAAGVKLRKPRVHLNLDAVNEANRIMQPWRRTAERLGANELLGLVVGSASKAKHYPAAQWAATLTKLWEDRRTMAILLGGEDDRETIDELAALLGSVPHFRLIKPVDLVTLSALIRQLDGMLAVDTGAAHIAVSLRVPTVVLVGGGHPNRFFPWPSAGHHFTLNIPMPCDGCKNQCHLSEPQCITGIQPEEIISAYLKLKEPDISLTPFILPAAAEEQTKSRKRKKRAAG